MNDKDIRESTTLLPEARTGVLLSGGKTCIEHLSVSPVLVAFIDTAGTISIHITNGVRGAQIAPKQRGSVAVLNPRIDAPVVVIESTATGCAGFSNCGQFLFVYSFKGIGYINLTRYGKLEVRWILDGPDNIKSVVTRPDRNELIVSGNTGGPLIFGWEKDEFVVLNKSVAVFSNAELKKFGKLGNIKSGYEQFAIISENTVIWIIDNISKIAIPTGEVLDVHFDSSWLLIHQTDSISLYNRSGDLLHVFRDTINKTKYVSVDTCGDLLVAISEGSSKKFHLEVFNIGLVSNVSSLLRWDVTRLVSDGCLVKFISPGCFVTTFVGNDKAGAVVWDSVVADQWYSVMPNFKVLPRNEPYLETEEEFDFNQDAPDSVVRSTLSRYRSLATPEFNFIPDYVPDTVADQVLVEPEICDIKRSDEPMYPFLHAWKQDDRKKNIVRHKVIDKRSVFFA